MTGSRPWYTVLYIQVIIAILIGIAVGYFFPDTGKALKPLGDGFIALIKMMIAPVIFCTVVHGVASMSDLKKVGRVGIKTLFYFEAVSTLALAIGLLVGEIWQPGNGFNIDPATLDPKAVATYVTKAKEESIVNHLLGIIPDSYFGALARGDLLQVLLISILTGFAIALLGERGQKIAAAIDTASRVFFSIIRIVVRAAPIGAFGAMAFTKDELLIVLGTSSSETVLPHLMQKMEHLGASKSVVGLVVPTGYSFNLDGTNIYMTLATLFLAQATNTPITITQELGILVIAMITSKGASGVTGAGFVTLAATLSIIPDIPVQSIAIILGIDKFMSECRALTNLVGNGVATIVVSRWEGELDRDKLHETMAHPITIGEEMENVKV